MAQDRAQVAEVMRAALHDRLWQGNGITVADDLHVLGPILGLNAELEEMWTTGGEGRRGPVGRESEAVRDGEFRGGVVVLLQLPISPVPGQGH